LNARNGYILSFNYKTENEFGRGKRKKIKRQFTDKDFFSTMKNNLYITFFYVSFLFIVSSFIAQ